MSKLWVVSLVLTLVMVIGQESALASSPVSSLRVALPANGHVALDQPTSELPAVVDTHRFHGLAQYLNAASFYKVSGGGIEPIEPDAKVVLASHEWLAVVGRYQALVVRGEGLGVIPHATSLEFASPDTQAPEAYFGDASALVGIDPSLEQIRYAHLWSPLAALAKCMEWLLAALHSMTGLGWGIVLVLFAILIKLILLPASLATARMQAKVEAHQRALMPQIAQIKQSYKGEEAHNLIMKAHKDRGLSPFYTLKPMLGLFVQIPVLIATFNALAHMPQLAGSSFLWVKDLAYPDAIVTFAFTLPMLGDSLNLMPILMALVSLLPAARAQDEARTVKRKRLQQAALALAFLLFFYTFPAAMVLYWLLANALRWAEQYLFVSKEQGRSTTAQS